MAKDKKQPKNMQAFVNAMKSKGIKYFDLGGGVQPGLAPQPTTSSSNVTAGMNSANPMANTSGALGYATLTPATNALTNVVGSTIGAAGSLAQDVGGAFTAQNQYQAGLAPTTQFNYAQPINQAAGQALAGYGQLQGNIGQEQALEQQLINQGNGQGPNPAQAALNQSTGQNVANQAALMAGQRGAGANAGLIARQAAQQGAGIQQNAVGQSSTLQAQQQLAAQQGAAALQGQIGNQITNEQAANNQLFGTSAGSNNTQNANLVSNYGMTQGLNQNTAQQNANATNSGVGGLLKGAASIFALADGGEVPQNQASSISSGFNGAMGLPKPAPKPIQPYAQGGPVSFAGQFLNNTPNMMGEFASPSSGNVASVQSPMASDKASSGMDSLPGMGGMGKSGSSSDSQEGQSIAGGQGEGIPSSLFAAKGGAISKEMASKGIEVPGKPKVPGKDTLKNDVVPAMLTPKEIVLPLSVTQAPNAPQKAAQFVQAIKAKQGLKRRA